MENYYKYLVEVKSESMEFVYDILVPYIDACIKDMFERSVTIYNKIEQQRKINRSIKPIKLEEVFKQYLEETKTLNSEEIEDGYLLVKNNSVNPESFDMIIKSAFKSYVLFFTWDPTREKSRVAHNQIFDGLIVKDFIYKSLVETTKYLENHIVLYIENKINMEVLIKKCINLAMRKSLPLNKILDEYLKLDFINIKSEKEKDLEDLKLKVDKLMQSSVPSSQPVKIGGNIEEFEYGKYGKLPNQVAIASPDSNLSSAVGASSGQDIRNFINNHKDDEHGVMSGNNVTNLDSTQNSHQDNESGSNKQEMSATSSDAEEQKELGKHELNDKKAEISEILKGGIPPTNIKNIEKENAVEELKQIKKSNDGIFGKTMHINKQVKVLSDDESEFKPINKSKSRDDLFNKFASTSV